MLPHADDLPAGSLKSVFVTPVTLDVCVQLDTPIITTRLRARAMLGTAMPETAIKEHEHASSSEDDIRPGTAR